jgi:hypothetical protein
MRVSWIRFLFACPLSIITACQTSIGINIEQSPYYRIPAGSTLTLNQPITFAPNVVSVYLYEGKIQPHATIDVYKPHCKFELYEMRATEQVINPDTFSIRKAVYQNINHKPSGPARVIPAVHTRSSYSPSFQPYTTYMYLQSEKQPNVYLLSCLHWEDPVEANYLTLAQIKQALGGVMTLAPKATPVLPPGQRS